MKYYRFIPNDPREKVFPQLELADSQVYDLTQPYSIWNLQRGKKIPKYIRIPKFSLKKKANLTDVLNSNHINSSFLILCNDTFLGIIQRFRIPDVEILPVDIAFKETQVKYNLLNFIESQDNLIDFNGSEFVLNQKGQPEGVNKQPSLIPIQSLDEYLIEKENNKIITKKIKLNNHLDYDLFRLSIGKAYFLVSEDLKKALSKEELTGFSFYTPRIDENVFIMDGRISIGEI